MEKKVLGIRNLGELPVWGFWLAGWLNPLPSPPILSTPGYLRLWKWPRVRYSNGEGKACVGFGGQFDAALKDTDGDAVAWVGGAYGVKRIVKNIDEFITKI